ncbi:TetR/AcrR family transcriptional regulator [Corynebacterium sp.]|uniref:TetR/AcrR family transcriptional regulator n=1 Tax=Corynebacterium sp. TaxID=1720 RepID=UPI0028A6161E|nr:TetR/AcrR family transcriptional regulator [Corynebacterium sp.]
MTAEKAPDAGPTHAAHPRSRTQRRVQATRRQIIDAARGILATDGADALTLDGVAERADVAVQTIYNRIGGRSTLLLAVAEQAMLESRGYMDAAYEAVGAPEDRLVLAATAYARFARECPQEFRILVEPPDLPEAVSKIAELTRIQNAKLARTIRDGMEAGTIRADLDPEALATVFWATMNGLLALTWRPGALQSSEGHLDQLLEAYIATMTAGLRPTG